MRLASHECRWFFEGALEGALEDEVAGAFKNAGGWRKSAEVGEPEWPTQWREDRYLVLPVGGSPADADMGIKWRDEVVDGKPRQRLEYKGRTSAVGPMALGPGAIGTIEQWIKWSYKGEEVPESALAPFLKGKVGVLVRKIRLQRKIRLDAYDHDEEVPTSGAGSFVDRGMFIELTKLRTEGHGARWTFGFEAFPQDTEIHEDFRRNAQRFLEGFADVADFSEERSMSYPEWLARL